MWDHYDYRNTVTTMDDLLVSMLNMTPYQLYQKHPEYFDTANLTMRELEGLHENRPAMFFDMGNTLEDLSEDYLYRLLIGSKNTKKYLKDKEIFVKKLKTKGSMSIIAQHKPAVFFQFGFDLGLVNEHAAIISLLRYCVKFKTYADRYDDVMEQAKTLGKTELRNLLIQLPALITDWTNEERSKTTLDSKEWILHVLKPTHYDKYFKKYVTDELVEELREDAFLYSLADEGSTKRMNNCLKYYEEQK